MRPLLRLLGSLAAIVLGSAVLSLGIDMVRTGPIFWQAGYFSDEPAKYFLVLGAVWLAGGLTLVAALLGFLAAARGRHGGSQGGGLATTALILVTAGLVLLAGALLTLPDPAVPGFLGIIAGVWLVAAVSLALSKRGKRGEPVVSPD